MYNIKTYIITIFLLLSFHLSYGQVRIKMQKEGGVYKIPCVVNGLKLKFIFDTGASNVCISLSEANLMLENGYLEKSDIVGYGKSQIADGSIINNTKIIIRELEINGLFLKDVEAVVINELKAPLLLGMSAIEKLGKIQIEGDEIVVLNAKGSVYSQMEIDKLFEQAISYYKNNLFHAATETYQKLYDLNQLNDYGIYQLANAYYMAGNYTKALIYFFEIIDKEFGNNDEENNSDKFSMNIKVGSCYLYLNELNKALLYIQKSKPFMKSNFEKYFLYSMLVDLHKKKEECYLLKENIYLSLTFQAKSLGFESNDITAGRAKNSDISNTLYLYASYLIECGETKEGGGMMIASAKYGYQAAIDYCDNHNLNYGSYF